ncbi:hypothetical protein HPG69_008577, partial [Diceros bicornis minor]
PRAAFFPDQSTHWVLQCPTTTFLQRPEAPDNSPSQELEVAVGDILTLGPPVPSLGTLSSGSLVVPLRSTPPRRKVLTPALDRPGSLEHVKALPSHLMQKAGTLRQRHTLTLKYPYETSSPLLPLPSMGNQISALEIVTLSHKGEEINTGAYVLILNRSPPTGSQRTQGQQGLQGSLVQQFDPFLGAGGSAERTARGKRGRGHPRRGGGACSGIGVCSSAAAPPDPGTPACPARRAPSLGQGGAPSLGAGRPFLLPGAAPPPSRPPRPVESAAVAAACTARPRSRRFARSPGHAQRAARVAGPSSSVRLRSRPPGAPAAAPASPAPCAGNRAPRHRNLGRTPTGPARRAAPGAPRLCPEPLSLPVARPAPGPGPRRPRVEMTFRDLLSVSFEGPRPDSSAGGSSAGGSGGGTGGPAASEGPAVGGVPGAAGGGGGGGVVGAGSGEDNRSSAGEPGGAGAGGEVNGTAAVEGLVVSAQGVGVGVFLAAFILTAVAGNLLVILSVACNRHLQTVTNYFIVNLAVADLLLSTTVLPFSATMEVLGFWAFGRAFCDVWAAVDVLCCTASILSLCTISVDRYVGVRHSLKYPAIMTERKAAAILALLWAVALVVSVGPLLGWKEPVPPDERFCGITEEAGYAVFSSLCSFYLPMAIIVVMYCRVYVVARSTTRSLEAGVKRERGKASDVVLRIHCRGASMGADGAHGMRSAKGHTFRSSLSVRLLKFSREKKAAKTLAIVVGVFVLCWFPFFFGVLSIAMGHDHFPHGLTLSQTPADPQSPEPTPQGKVSEFLSPSLAPPEPCPNLLHELYAHQRGLPWMLEDLPALALGVVTQQNRVLGP